jgi:hypothetical protein
MTNKAKFAAVVLGLALSSVFPFSIRAEDAIEKTGMGVELTAGNLIFFPLKAFSMIVGVSASGLSYVVTGGDTEVSSQLWRDTTQGPYLISPDLARKSIGERPELPPKK